MTADTITDSAFRSELRLRRALARQAKSLGLQWARRFHIEVALDARRNLNAAAR